ncbi:Protein CBG18666 [Caenorhabditis briggsae]|uniref:Protein CBG18666 n=1 Tax=Caenorhabditis briggsae TaxID=6238 RepID=A8XTU9_CAEBR|nr:Protein CBG18666 [Caenorhabditis briggsae]CAP36075.2 Protein CBG18666 [Caenorhabditis briggsae]
MVTTFDVVVVGAVHSGPFKWISHGKSRIIRYAHAAPEYVPLVADAYTQIEALEKKRGEKLWNKLGLLWAATGNQVNEISVHLKNLNIEHEVIPGNEISNHYPQLKFDEKWTGLVDPMGGVIYANKCKLGLLWAATGNQVNEISVHLKNLNIEHEVIPGNEISNHYPQLKFDEKWTGLVDPMGVWLVDLSQFHDLSQLTNCLQSNRTLDGMTFV